MQQNLVLLRYIYRTLLKNDVEEVTAKLIKHYNHSGRKPMQL